MNNDIYIKALKFAYERQEKGFTWADLQSELSLDNLQMNWIQNVLRSNMPIGENLVDHIYESGNNNTCLFLTSKGVSEAKKYTELEHKKGNKRGKKVLFTPKGDIPYVGTLHWDNIWNRIRGKKYSYVLLGIFFLLLLYSLYTFFLKDSSYFGIEMYGQAFQARDSRTPTVIDLWLEQKVTNLSEDERYLESVHYILWRDEFLGRTWAYGYGTGEVYVTNGNERQRVYLPILFKPNEVKTVALSVDVEVSDEETFAFLSERDFWGDISWTKNSFDVLLEDSRGNIFDKSGKLISQKVTDAWWVFPNNKDMSGKFFASIDLVVKITKWKIKRFLHYIS